MFFKDARKDLVEIGMKLASAEEGYPEDFLIHVALFIKSKGIDIELAASSLPEAELIIKDLELLIVFEKRTRCFFGCSPLSYQYFDCYLEDPTLEGIVEQACYKSVYSKIDAPFTKQEFLQSIKKRKETKKLIRK